MSEITPTDLDVRPENWHPSWIRYSEFNGVACILHYVGTDYIHLCVVRADCVPTDNHDRYQWTPEFFKEYALYSGGRDFHKFDMERAVNLWVLWDSKIRMTDDQG